MSFLQPPNFEFAVRCFEIEQQIPGKWPETPNGNFPHPPRAYRINQLGYNLPWQRWTAICNDGPRLRPAGNQRIRERDTTTLVWCQESQSFWVSPCDFTDPNYAELGADPNNYYHWSPLYFDPLVTGQSPLDGGIYRVSVHGEERQLNYWCPSSFEEYLPVNKFTNTSQYSHLQIPCRLIGNLSLILGLHAMCPEDIRHIEQQFNYLFWQNQEAVYSSGPYNNFNGRMSRNKNGTYDL